jgi:hypothetical protein
MMVNLINVIGTFDTRVAELLIVIGIAAVGDGVRLIRAGARPERHTATADERVQPYLG